MKRLVLGLAAAAALSAAAPAHADVQIIDYSVTGDGSGTFTLALDTDTSIYSLTALDLTFGTASFNTSTTGITPLFGTYFLGGNLNGLNGIAPNTNDFMMIFNPTLATQALNVTYTNIGNNSFSGARVTTSQVTAAVPEPSTWLMMIFGFGAIGAALRRGRRTARLVQAT